MGKAATELPDALDPTDMAEKAAAVDVDELLAQMAGEEIDRLLSEGEDPLPREPKPVATPQRAAPVAEAAPEPAAPDPIDDAVAHQLEEAVDPTAADDGAVAEEPAPTPAAPAAEVVVPAPAPAAPPAPPAPDDPLAKQLDDLFAQLEGTDAPPPAAPAAAAPSPAVAETPPPAAVPESAPAPAPPVEEPIATSVQERSALDAPMPSVEIVSGGQGADDEALPWYLKPLEWINAPLDALPDPIRELIGKLGLLTLFNACAVLLYVYVFRKHHH